MEFTYAFDNQYINLILVFGFSIYFLLGVFLLSKAIYKIYYSEYIKDPKFETVPTALRWKFLLLIIISGLLIGPAFLSVVIMIMFVFLYLLYPISNIEPFTLIKWILYLCCLGVYYKWFAKKIELFLFSFIQKTIEFEHYFLANAKNWGILRQGDQTYFNQGYDKEAKWVARVGIHIGIVPAIILVLINIF